jgi:penicillin-binding protein 1A
MKAYAKTGTTSDTKDAWLVGGTPYYVGSVWYGFDHNHQVSNNNMAKNIWRDVMKEIHKDLEKKEFIDSEDVFKKGIGYYKEGTKPDNVLYSITSSEETTSSETTSQTSSNESASSSQSNEQSTSQNSSETTSSETQTSSDSNVSSE